MKSRGNNPRRAVLSDRAATGVETWKLVALTGLIVFLAVAGAFAWDLLKSQSNSAGVDLGLEVGAARSLTTGAEGVS